jgi:hypothetical protein
MDNNMAITTTGNAALVEAMVPEDAIRILNQINSFQAVIQNKLQSGRDYGTIPGTNKPTLFKSGAEKINMIFGIYQDYEFIKNVSDFEHGFFNYEIRCTLYRNGRPVSQGVGSCNSREKKYRYAIKNKSQLAECGIAPENAISFTDRNGYTKYRVEDPDIADKANTILKMAKKRALLDATLQLASLSEIFTQDMEDYADQIAQEAAETVSEADTDEMRVPPAFKKHAGESLTQLWENDKGYFNWMLEKAKNLEPALRKAMEMIKAGGSAQSEQERAPMPDDNDAPPPPSDEDVPF